CLGLCGHCLGLCGICAGSMSSLPWHMATRRLMRRGISLDHILQAPDGSIPSGRDAAKECVGLVQPLRVQRIQDLATAALMHDQPCTFKYLQMLEDGLAGDMGIA